MMAKNYFSGGTKNKITISFFGLMISLGLVAQEKPIKHNLKLSFLPEVFDFNTNESYFLVGLSPGLTYECRVNRYFNPFVTIKFNGPVSYDFAKGETSENIQTLGYQFTVGNKFFLAENSFARGFYIAPALSAGVIRFNEVEDNSGLYLQFKDLVVRERIGYQWTTSKRVCWEVFTGVGVLFRNYFDNTLSEGSSVINVNRIGLKPEFGVCVGYSM